MLQIEHLSFDVRDDGRQAEILSDISFNVADGEMLVITGPNGGGKSTLAKLLMGINEATSGRIILNGEDITTSPSMNVPRLAQVAFQQPPRFKGLTRPPPSESCSRKNPQRERMLRFSQQCRSLCPGIY